MTHRAIGGYRADPREKPPHHLILSRRHGIKRITLPRWSLGAAWVVFGLLTVWSVGSTGFILFRDEFVAGIISREASMQYGYEGRIATLKAEVAKLQSRQLVDKQSFGEKLDMLMRRQASLESRQAILQSLDDMATAVGIAPAVPRPMDEPAPQPPKAGGRQAQIELKAPVLASAVAQAGGQAGVDGKLTAVTTSLDTVERRQAETLLALGTRARQRAERIRDAFDEIGLDADRIAVKVQDEDTAQGGPFIPLELAAHATPFETMAFDVQKALADAEGLDKTLASVPLRRPFPNAKITSVFGARSDPFLGSAAMHAGIDFRGETGAPVRATANGVVGRAGWVGGYGNMVEIEHGHGLSTRFAHMSEILVSPGEKIAIGQIVGRVGSTGRSTGPHLHYETRIGGEAVDPMRFIRAGRSLEGEAG